jgi:type VI secretion system protein VasJ
LGSIDWQKVTDLAAVILAEKSKDLLVTSYLAVSQVHLNRMEGLIVGLTNIHDLMAHHWENLFPPKKRIRGRLSAIEWWLEKTNTALEKVEPKPIAPQKLEEINTTLSQIDTLLGEYLPEPPLLRPIQRFVENIPALTADTNEPKPEQTQPPPETTPKPEPEQKQAELKPQPAPTGPEDITNLQDAQKVINSGLKALLKVASFLLEKDPMNPVGYRYRRLALWSKVSNLPAATNSKTQIPPPTPQIQQPLTDLRNNANWSALLKSAEQRLSHFIFWLDLNRFVAESLAGLGEDYQQAHDVVCQETAFVLHRFPGLVELLFSDGTPIADSETKSWLKSIELGSGRPMSEALQVTDTGGGANGKDKMIETIKTVQALAKQNKLVDAVKSLQAELQSSFSKKEALLWRLALCQILIGSKRTDMALPHLELILKDIDAFRLSTWDPELALKGLKVVWTGFNNHTNKEYKHNAETVLNRISELDPVAALNLVK